MPLLNYIVDGLFREPLSLVTHFWHLFDMFSTQTRYLYKYFFIWQLLLFLLFPVKCAFPYIFELTFSLLLLILNVLKWWVLSPNKYTTILTQTKKKKFGAQVRPNMWIWPVFNVLSISNINFKNTFKSFLKYKLDKI